MATCKTCAAEFTWRQVGEKWIPFDADGEVHFSRCKRRMKAIRRGLDPETPVPFKSHSSGFRRGENYRHYECICETAPWERCEPWCQKHNQLEEAA